MIGLFLHPLVLIVLLWIVARENAELEFSTVFFVALGIGLGSLAINGFLGETLGIFTIVPVAALAVFLLMRFCYTTLGQAAVVVTLFALYLVGFSFALDRLLSA